MILSTNLQTHVDSLDGTATRGLFPINVASVVHSLYMKSDDTLNWQVYGNVSGVDFLLFQTEPGSPQSALYYSDQHRLPVGASLKVFASGALGRNPTVTMVWSPYTESSPR